MVQRLINYEVKPSVELLVTLATIPKVLA